MSISEWGPRRLLSLIIVGTLLVSSQVCSSFSMSITIGQSVSATPEDWWNFEWAFRKAMTINHSKVSADLENFPVLINMTDSDLAKEAQADGDDIVFTDSSGNRLSHEIELYESSTGYLVAWVKVPVLSSTHETKLYMYYGNPYASNQQNPHAVWDPNFVIVHHLDEKSGKHYDSTLNGNNGTASEGVIRGSPGKIDGADTFDGISGYVTVPHSNTITGFTTAFTASVWIKPSNVTKRQSILQKFKIIDNQRGWMIEYRTDVGNAIALLASPDGEAVQWWYASFNPFVDTWYYLTVVWQANAIPKFYINGQQVPTVRKGTISQIYNNIYALLHIGKSTYAAGREFKGIIDEVRISNVSRSANWILTSFRNQEDPSTFYMIGEQEHTGAPLISDENPRNGAINVYTNPTLSVRVRDLDGDHMNVTFWTNATGTWKDIGSYNNVVDGIYSLTPTNMKNLGTKYYWNVSVTDGKGWTNKTYSFMTTATVLTLKWKAIVLEKTSHNIGGVLIADVTGNALEEVIYASNNTVTVLNGTDGSVIWAYSNSLIGESVQPQIADLNRDSKLEIIVPLNNPAGVLVLHGTNGSIYWMRKYLGGSSFSSPVVADIDGDGYATIFFASQDTTKGLNGSGRVTALSHDGQILCQTFSWRACAGGLSIADTDNDGEFELYMGDRHMYYTKDAGYGKGVRSFWAKNLTSRWNHPDILCSSHRPMLADVNKDGILDVIIGHHYGGIAVLNSTDGSAMRKTLGIPDYAPVHYQPSVYDIDGDGDLEILMADGSHDRTTNDIVIWDLVKWKVDTRTNVGQCYYGPQVADVTGDGIMDIIAANYTSIFIFNKTYSLIAQVNRLSPKLNYAVVQDIDGDDYNELVISSQSGRLYAFDTPARRPSPRPRSEVEFYSERRLGAAEYVPPPGRPEPFISAPCPSNSTRGVPVSLAELSFSLTDFQRDSMSYIVITSPNIGSGSRIDVGSGKYTIPVSNLQYSTTYTWRIVVTDGEHSTTQTFIFSTDPMPLWWNKSWQYRKLITIDHTKVRTDLGNFPVLIDMVDSDVAEKTQPDGDDIVFTDGKGLKLDHKIELFDTDAGHLVAWVEVPVLFSMKDTRLYMYYGNPYASNQQSPYGVWDRNFMMVFHLNEKTGIHYDSTINGNNGRPYNGVTQGITGKIDGADMFDGIDDFIEVPHSNTISGFTDGLTVSFWARLNDITKRQSMIQKFMTAGDQRGWLIEYRTDVGNAIALLASQDGVNVQWWYTPFNPVVDTWYYLTVVWQSNAIPGFFINGQRMMTVRNGIMSKIYNNIYAPLHIGKSIYAAGRVIKGSLDEIQISNIARSADWILTSYSNQETSCAFYMIGDEETVPEAPVISDPSPLDGSKGVLTSLSELSFSLTDYQSNLMSFTVTTFPDIGTSKRTNVASGRFTIPISGLTRSKTYRWRVSVTEGTHLSDAIFTFTTYPGEPPAHGNPLLVSSDAKFICYNQTTSDPDGDKVTNIYHWYRNNASTTSLLLPFEKNDSATTKDYSGYGNNGTIVGRVVWTNNGRVGGAYRFVRGYIRIPGTESLDGNGNWSEMTLEHWICLSRDQNGTRTIAKIPSYEIGLTLGSKNTVFAGIWTDSDGYYDVRSPTPLQKGKWYHIAFTYKSGEGLTLYINGTTVATRNSISGKIKPSGTEPVYIGWFDYFQGKIDEVRIYPKRLSPEQIRQRYIETKGGLSSSSTIVSQETAVSDAWRCEVTPNDSWQDGTTKSSSTVTRG